MKTVILAGGVGSRLSEETHLRPKPMVQIGGRPILWHIMHVYAHFGQKDFVVALGYMGEQIKHYFNNYYLMENDLKVDLGTGEVEAEGYHPLDWRVHLVDTGENSMTGGRIKRLKQHIGNETFMLTYGDGLADIDVDALLDFHKSHGRLATVTAVRPPARFGSITFDGDRVAGFAEKHHTSEGWINGGFFVLEPDVFEFIQGDYNPWEQRPMEGLARGGNLMAYRHHGFWQPMDTLREKEFLNNLWEAGQAPWKLW